MSSAPSPSRRRLAVAPLDKWLATTRRLLAQERDDEVRGAQEALAALDDAANPNVLTQLTLAAWRTALFGRALLTLALPSTSLQRAKPHAFTVGDLVQIRMASSSSSSASASFPTGIVARVEETAISIALGDREELEEEQLLAQSGRVTLDRLVNNATFAKIDAALDQLATLDYGAAQCVVDVVFSGKSPAWHTPLPTITPFNGGLNASQLEAIRFALASKDLALIHGPPGTGKTTTVVEFILQAVKTFKMKVLVCAPSNIAVDNVLEKMASVPEAKPLRLTRVGHPARLLPQIVKYCLDARIESAEGTGIVHDIRKETQQMESQLKKTRDKSERFQLRRKLKANRKEIRQREQKVVVELLQHSDVVFATNVGAASKLLKDTTFDLVVIDEAAQALEASCWIPILKAKRCVLAGDHLQLPPTIKSKAAASSGLETTLFDRVTQFAHTQEIVKMLNIQYRMHSDISDWSSRAMYHGELQSFEGVAARKLHQIAHVNVAEDDELLNATLLLIDTAGCDLEEDIDEDEESQAGSRSKATNLLKLSKSNTGEAQVVATHVRALLKAGLRTEEVAVITPYNKQVQLLKGLLLEEFPALEIRSVDGFQGCEKEAVVMSLVRSNAAKEVGFLADERRMNVAITRAKRHVAVVCDTDTIQSNKFLKKMVEHFEEHGEYRSAQEFLDEEVVHGQGAASDVAASVKTVVGTEAVEEAPIKTGNVVKKTAAVSPTPVIAKKTSSTAKEQQPLSSKSTAAKIEAPSWTGAANEMTASTEDTEDQEAEESNGESEEVEAAEEKKASIFDMLKQSWSSDESGSEEEEEEKKNGKAPADSSKPEELSSATALLRDLHMSRLARQPAPPAPQPSTGGKKNKNKKKKGKRGGSSAGGGGTTVAVDTPREDEDDLAFLTRQADQSSRCCFQSTARCKKSVTTLGAVCKYCKLKFCFDHAQPEVHGCGDAARQFERQQFRSATSASSSDTKKLTADKRKLLQKKLGDKVGEQSASRQAKTKAKGKK